MKNSILWFCRIFVGLLFIFSGLVKANDPVGFGIKLDEYYQVFAETWPWTSFLFRAEWLLYSTTLQAAFLITLEVVLGIALILGMKRNLVAWLLLLLILFFTWLTGFTAVTGTPSDCGCFGDAIPLTSLQSFYKDLVLTVLILIIFFLRRNIKPLFSPAVNRVLFLMVSGFALWVNIHVIRHDVFIDFRPYAKGKNIQEQMVAPEGAAKGLVRMDYIYENKNNGEREIISLMSDNTDYTLLQKYSDTNQWQFIERKDKVIEEAYLPKTQDFNISDLSGANLTQRILNYPDVLFMIVCHDFEHTTDMGWMVVNELQEESEKEGVVTFALVGEGASEIEAFRHEHQTPYPFYPADAKVCLTIARVNPSVVLLNKGTVVDKWGWREVPPFSEIKQMYFPDRVPLDLVPIIDEIFVVNEDVRASLEAGDEGYAQFYLEDSTGNDATGLILSDTSTVYLMIVNETNKEQLSSQRWTPINNILHVLDSANATYYVVSSAPDDIQKAMRKFAGLNYTYFISDRNVLHKVAKQNATLLVIKNGIVVKKFTEAFWPADKSYLTP